MDATAVDFHKIEPICRANGITRLLLFGSLARGEATSSSDVDLIADLPPEATLLDLIRIEREFSSALGMDVDLLTQDSISPYIRERIVDDVRVLYEAR
jgi:predicted nucleotidyltransferase